MKVIVIRQPWAWLIVHGFKDIENRSWRTRYRGALLIQASAGLPTKHALEDIRRFVRKRGVDALMGPLLETVPPASADDVARSGAEAELAHAASEARERRSAPGRSTEACETKG